MCTFLRTTMRVVMSVQNGLFFFYWVISGSNSSAAAGEWLCISSTAINIIHPSRRNRSRGMQQRLTTQVQLSSLFRRGIGLDIRWPSLPRPPIPCEVGRSISVRRHCRRRRRRLSDAPRRCTPDTSCAVSSTLVRHCGVSRDARRDGAGNTRRRRRRRRRLVDE